MSLHIFDELEQGSPEWHDQRRGIVTASAVGRLVTSSSKSAIDFTCPDCLAFDGHPCLALRSKTVQAIKTLHAGRIEVAKNDTSPPTLQVADNDESRNLTATLATERIAGWTEETYRNADMWRGVVAEPFARDIYSGLHQQAVECGFMLREEDGWSLGYSPDGLVADDGLVEVKSPRSKTHVLTTLADKVPAHYMAQCQAGLLVSGRKWIDWVSYCGGLPLYVKRVYPDPVWFEVITAACVAFEANAAALVADYRGRVEGLPTTERIDFNLEVI